MIEIDNSPPPYEAATSRGLRGIFKQTVSSVAVITAGDRHPVGFTATSVTCAAVEPPVVTFGVARASRSHKVISRMNHVGIHFLRGDQERVARTFADSDADKFGDALDWYCGPYRIPILRNCLSSLLCDISDRHEVSESNTLVVARVMSIREVTEAGPLTYGDGRYH